ncbi:mitotic spindle checkpoint HORMA domain-containing protein [Wolfiporia cocos MD-104 SS10]|uniref:Mitotic spindle checkpoint HORMA domain-containing protein n=1 Tax=Wolfiporia cocos (strain MD-104) TaxID=742152 RepID=A0A2H3JBE9_WOLCO|nr:mitotic spindle checkpoint HORMA domain-containing protein [Wolfiporia cocos MD-104 SS10]
MYFLGNASTRRVQLDAWSQTVQGIAEFIEVAIHTILYVRQIYPVDLFVRRKKYNTPVFQSRHPALNEYISGAVGALAEELATGSVDKIAVVVKNQDDVALERFIFAVQNMINVDPYNKDISVEGAIAPSSLGQYLRSFLVKLNMIEAQLGQLDSCGELSFAIVLELHDNKAPATSYGEDRDPPPWVPALTPHTTAGAADTAELHMVRAVDTGIINLSLAVQESAEKLKLGREDPKGKGRVSS